MAAHFEDEKHPSDRHCPDPNCTSAPVTIGKSAGTYFNSTAEETLYEHFLSTHHCQMPTETASAMATLERKDTASAQIKADADDKAKLATKAAFVQWLIFHGKADHPTTADVQAKVTAFTGLFLEGYTEAKTEDSPPDPELGERLTWDGVAAVYAYTLETELYSKVWCLPLAVDPATLSQRFFFAPISNASSNLFRDMVRAYV